MYDELFSIAEPILTRKSDIHIELYKRAYIANAAQADLFVSVHCNSADSDSAGGTETYALKPGGESNKLAQMVQRSLVSAVGLADRGIKFASFVILRLTLMPAVLVELAFISNPTEERLLADPDWQKKAAKAIAKGIANYLGTSLGDAGGEKGEGPFIDVKNHWARNEIEQAYKLGLITGQGNKIFNPDGALTRAEGVALLMRLYRLLKGGNS